MNKQLFSSIFLNYLNNGNVSVSADTDISYLPFLVGCVEQLPEDVDVVVVSKAFSKFMCFTSKWSKPIHNSVRVIAHGKDLAGVPVNHNKKTIFFVDRTVGVRVLKALLNTPNHVVVGRLTESNQCLEELFDYNYSLLGTINRVLVNRRVGVSLLID